MIWQQRRLRNLLRSVVYLGDYYSHSTVCLTPGHQVVNRGYRDRYYIEEHHEALVSRKMFDRVQRMISSGALRSCASAAARQRLVDNGWRNEPEVCRHE